MTSEIARNYWYPVALSEEVGDHPVGTQLLGEPLVLARLGGQVAAFRDLCIHRGTPLSMGRIEEQRLVCAYHGWQYDGKGTCVRIPQRPPEKAIPPKARVPSYRVSELHGVVWVCLDESDARIPPLPEFSDSSYRTIFWRATPWKATAARMMENFIDTSHFAWVHAGVLGTPDRPEVSVGPLRHLDDGFTVDIENDAPGGGVFGRTVQGDQQWTRETVHVRYEFPYFLTLVRQDGDSRYMVFIAIHPLSSTASVRYTWIARNFAFERPDEEFLHRLETLSEQDRTVVESQRPEDLPLDLSEEMHVAGVDDPAVAFRRILRRMGIGAA
jgi:phenylpropionate dioxygenase-like ring-hydroxylating dioxygenase large terminal subunit